MTKRIAMLTVELPELMVGCLRHSWPSEATTRIAMLRTRPAASAASGSPTAMANRPMTG
jgi:hypothetical protein